MKQNRKPFFVTLPDDESSLKCRFEVMGHCLMMLKLMYFANPILATIDTDLMKEYAEWLCGEYVWGLVVKGSNGQPLACPHIGQVLQYDMAIRELAAKLMKKMKIIGNR